MKKRLIDNIRSPLSQVIAGLLISISVALAVSGILAQTPTPTPALRGKCAKWPCDPADLVNCTDTFRAKVKKVFIDLMNAASTGDTEGNALRAKLLDEIDCPKCRKQAYEIVKDKLEAIKVPFGPEHVVIFYEPENPVDASFYSETRAPLLKHPKDRHSAKATGSRMRSMSTPSPKYPNNHCLHVFYLPEPGGTANDQSLKCCYQPW